MISIHIAVFYLYCSEARVDLQHHNIIHGDLRGCDGGLWLYLLVIAWP